MGLLCKNNGLLIGFLWTVVKIICNHIFNHHSMTYFMLLCYSPTLTTLVGVDLMDQPNHKLLLQIYYFISKALLQQ